ncbi:hypothetical protein ACOSQ2_027910 [Xanthoceras sorbifolium]
MIKKAELVFVPAPGVGHLVSTLEFAKRLIDRDDRILITVLVMKLPFSSFAFVDAHIKSSITASQSGSAIRLIDLPEILCHPDLAYQNLFGLQKQGKLENSEERESASCDVEDD